MDFNTLIQDVVTIAMNAGDILLNHFRQPIEQSSKSDVIDIVTIADKNSEAFIIQEILARFPDHYIVGEEGGGVGADPNHAEYFWFVDPLDGTVNFANGIAHFAVSIALADRNRQPLIGVVYHPSADECFTAIAGGGAQLNGMPIRVSQTDELVQSLIASGFAYDRRTNPDNNLPQWNAFIPRVRDLRRLGSAALDLSYVACGRFDAYWERSLKLWDAMAGMLIVREAGGVVTDYEGEPYPQWGEDGRYIASNGVLHPIMMHMIAESYGA